MHIGTLEYVKIFFILYFFILIKIKKSIFNKIIYFHKNPNLTHHTSITIVLNTLQIGLVETYVM